MTERWLSMTADLAETEAFAAEYNLAMSQVTHADSPRRLLGLILTGVNIHRSATFYYRPDAVAIETVVNRSRIKSGLPALTPFFDTADA